MRIAAGILMLIGAVVLAVIGFQALAPSVFLLLSGDASGFIRGLAPLFVLLLAFALGFGGYRALKRKRRDYTD